MKKKNSTATLEDTVVVSYKTKHTLSIQSSNCAPWYLFKGVENLRSHENLHTNIQFVHNCQNLEATNVAFDTQ